MSASHRLRERASQMDVDGLLAKPFDLDELLANIERLLTPPPRDEADGDPPGLGR
jgi:hypothetical protein